MQLRNHYRLSHMTVAALAALSLGAALPAGASPGLAANLFVTGDVSNTVREYTGNIRTASC